MLVVRKQRFVFGPKLMLLVAILIVMAGCVGTPEAASPDVASGQPQGLVPASELDWRRLPSPDHTSGELQAG